MLSSHQTREQARAPMLEEQSRVHLRSFTKLGHKCSSLPHPMPKKYRRDAQGECFYSCNVKTARLSSGQGESSDAASWRSFRALAAMIALHPPAFSKSQNLA
eukprot:365207-Pleurochrysis_carterae.AAC.1